MKAAATTESGDSAAEEGQMTKEQKAAAIKALTECHCSGFTAADIKTLEAFDDAAIERLTAASAARQRWTTTGRWTKQTGLRSRCVPRKQASRPRADATPRWPPRQTADAASGRALVLKLAALGTRPPSNSARSRLDLKTLATFAKGRRGRQ
jgi:hypothetical protein